MAAKAVANSMSPQQQNILARNIVIQNSVNAIRQIFQTSFTTGPGTVLNIPLQNVGIIKRLWVKVAATITGTGGGPTHTLTTLGGSTFFSNVALTDLSNQFRVNTSSVHLTAVATAKARVPYGSSIVSASTDTPFGYGNNFLTTQQAPASINAVVATNNTFLYFEVPLAYSDNDLRGSLYAGVVNATMNLQLTVNPQLFVGNTADATFSMYQSSTGVVATMPACQITVYQNYLDQLPIGQKGGPILPLMDLGTAYLLNQTVFSGITQNQDNPFPYPNFRDILSTYFIYDNNSTLNAGTDIAQLSIQSANFTNIVKYDPSLASLFARTRMQADFPKGTYYIDTRDKPISTVQFGNMALLFNPSSVASAAASVTVFYESLAIINQVTNAGSLAGS